MNLMLTWRKTTIKYELENYQLPQSRCPIICIYLIYLYTEHDLQGDAKWDISNHVIAFHVMASNLISRWDWFFKFHFEDAYGNTAMQSECTRNSDMMSSHFIWVISQNNVFELNNCCCQWFCAIIFPWEFQINFQYFCLLSQPSV